MTKQIEVSEEEAALLKFVRSTNAFDLLVPMIMGRLTLDPFKSKETEEVYVTTMEFERFICAMKNMDEAKYEGLIETASYFLSKYSKTKKPVDF